MGGTDLTWQMFPQERQHTPASGRRAKCVRAIMDVFFSSFSCVLFVLFVRIECFSGVYFLCFFVDRTHT